MKRKYLLVSTFFLLVVLFSSCASTKMDLKKEQANNPFLQAKRYYEKGQLDSAEVKVRQLIKTDPTLACAYNLLGKIYRERGGLTNRIASARAIRKAIELEPLNQTYHHNLGLTYLEQDFREYAIDEFKKAAELDASYIQPWIKMGDAHKQHAIIYDEDKYYAKATDCYKHALSIDSLSGEALYDLASIFLLKKNYAQAKSILQKIIEGSFDSVKVLLLYGYLEHRMENYHRANVYYSKALVLMSPEAREIYFDITPLLSEEQEKDYAQLDDEGKLKFRKSFWMSIDPDPSTEINERKLEHYSRIVYSDISFSVSHLDVRGYESDRGKMCIKFGEPDFKYYQMWDFVGGGFGGTTRVIPSKWHWFYSNRGNPFSLAFENRFQNGNYVIPYSPGARGIGGDYTSLTIDAVSAVTPQIYDFDYGGELLRCLHKVYQFKRDENKTHLSVVYSIPNSELRFSSLGQLSRADIEEKYIVFDLDWQKVKDGIDRKEFLVPTQQTTDSNLLVTDLFSFELPSGDYQLSWSIKDSLSKKIAVLKVPLEVGDFSSDSLGLSSLVLADKIKVDTKGDFVRKGYSISPNFNHTFYANQDLQVYYEVYNLKKDWEGRTYWQSECKVISLKKGRRGKIKRTNIVSQSLKSRSINTEEVESFSLSLMDAKMGEYELVIKIIDLNRGVSKERICRFRLIKRE